MAVEVNAIRYAVSTLAEIRKHTNGFTLNVDALTDEQVTGLPNVSREFANFLPCLFDVLHPKHYAELRRAIAYVYNLHERQQQAWASMAQVWQDQSDLLHEIINTPDPAKRLKLTMQYCDGGK